MEADSKAGEQKLTRREVLTRATQAGLGMAAAATLGPLAACAPAAPAQPAAGAAPAAPAVLKGQTIVIGIWGGAFAGTLRQAIVPDFEKDHGVKVTFDEGLSEDHMAKARAQQPKPEMTVMSLDEPNIPLLAAEGLLAQLTPQDVPNLRNVDPKFSFPDGYGVGLGIFWMRPYYNTKFVKEITSYADFWNPAYKGRVVIYSMKPATSSTPFLIFASAIGTGKSFKEAQYDLDPGFAKIKELKPNLHSMTDASLAVIPLMAQGDVWLFNAPSRIVVPFIVKGAPLTHANPKEGTVLHLNVEALVKNGPLPELGKDWINRMLSEKAQLAMLNAAYNGSVIRSVQVPAALRGMVPGPDDWDKMIRPDWAHLIKGQRALIDRWNREIAS
ncbi:MAG: extracellular solute-binding protein [Chloroflexi bacterium]|nr:extracellular solute-binding protein [Chloroflexota bacterium]